LGGAFTRGFEHALRVAPIAARNHAGAQAVGAQVFHHGHHHWGLAGAAHDAIAHHDHRQPDAFAAPQPAAVEQPAQAHKPTEQQRQRPQRARQCSALQPGLLQTLRPAVGQARTPDAPADSVRVAAGARGLRCECELRKACAPGGAASITLMTLWWAAVASAEMMTTRSFSPPAAAASSAASSSMLRPSSGFLLTA
jgi:hypothetical protein